MLDAVKEGDRKAVVELRLKYLRAAAIQYKSLVDLAHSARNQFDDAVPWIAEDPQGEGADLIQTICPDGKR